jgi:hypothetical protein
MAWLTNSLGITSKKMADPKSGDPWYRVLAREQAALQELKERDEMKKPTKEQIEAAINAMSSWHSAYDKKESLMYVLAPHLQYAPEPVDGDLVERMCQAYKAPCSCGRIHSFCREAMTAAARVCLEAALGDVTKEEIEGFRSSYFANGSNWQENTARILRSFTALRCSRLLHKQPEERVTVEEVHTTPLNYTPNCAFTVTLNGKPAGPLHSCREYAEIYADGLRFRLAKEKEAK